MRFPRTRSLLTLTVFALFLTTLAYADLQDDINERLLLAEQGDASAQFNLGRLYDEGRGVPQDFAQAAAWYRKAASQGNVPAMINLARLYEKAKNYTQAHMWFNLAAAQNPNSLDAPYGRDLMELNMTPEQIAEAQRLASEWFAQHQQ